jgi:tryptophan synthase alpha chain
MKNRLMPYLIVNYPNPDIYQDCLKEVLSLEPEFLEIQIPFSNPVADGAVIKKADQKALKYDQSILKSLQQIQKISLATKSKTKLVLMSYISKLIFEGLDQVGSKLAETGFYGLVCPDMPYGSPEQKQLTNLWQNQQTYLIPVTSPTTSLERLNKIKSDLVSGQMVYPTARIGKTGKKTSFHSPEAQQYLDFLQNNFKDYLIAIGFGVRCLDQIKLLNQKGFVAIIATRIIQEINQAIQQNQDPVLATKNLIQNFLGTKD